MTSERRCGSTTAALRATALLVLAVGAAWLTAPARPGWAGGRGAAESRRGQGGRPLPADLRIGDAAPEAVLETLDGDHIRMSQLRGKVVVLDFWATWCVPCIAALPSLKKLEQAHGDRRDRYDRHDQPFALVSISADTNGARLREFVANHEMGWTQCWDGNSNAQRAYGVRSLPTYFVIDPAGSVLYVRTGWSRGAERELDRQVERALAQGAAARQAAAAGR
jgi:thiol-disulfide isomerase/thioredoxin